MDLFVRCPSFSSSSSSHLRKQAFWHRDRQGAVQHGRFLHRSLTVVVLNVVALSGEKWAWTLILSPSER